MKEKLFSKASDAVLSRAFREIGLKSTVLKERGDSADVLAESLFHGYTLVADAKAFRMSRTAKNQKDFKDTVAGQRVERKKAQSSESLKPSKGEQIFEVLALGLVKQLKAGKGPMLSNVVLEDGERKTNDDVIAQVLAAKDLSLDGFVTYLERSPDPLLRADRAAHQFCLRIKD